MKTFSLFVLLLSLSLSFNLQARPGDLDATFGVSGVQVYDFGTLGWFTTPTHVDMDYFQKIRLNQDGKLLLSTNSYSSGYLLKINSDGSVDTGFSTEGLIRTPITGFDLNADGKILYSAVSYELPSDRISSHSIIATPQDGNSQTQVGSINAGEKLSAIQQDGKIIVSGADGRSGLWTLKRLLPTGELDETFGVHGIVELSMRAAFYMIPYIVKIDSDGKILIAGGIEWSHSGAYTRDFIIFRINTDGSRDTSFGPEGMKIIWFDDMVPRAEAAIHSVAIQADGKIVVAGGVLGAAYLATADPGPTAGRSSLYIARLNHDGTLDTGFNFKWKTCNSFFGWHTITVCFYLRYCDPKRWENCLYRISRSL
ncbi:MAG: hypothetical protein IPJ69_05225 [Deltaproteobacteria bacterium]|nr:MAG: hypothetical protein IPJ69_05225 [Deltaproteobacteria bacterium]